MLQPCNPEFFQKIAAFFYGTLDCFEKNRKPKNHLYNHKMGSPIVIKIILLRINQYL